MAKSPTELLAEFAPAVATLGTRLDTVERSIDGLTRRQADGGATHQSLHGEVIALREQIEMLNRWKIEIGSLVDIRTDMAVMKRDVGELRTAKIKSVSSRSRQASAGRWCGRRAWSFVVTRGLLFFGPFQLFPRFEDNW